MSNRLTSLIAEVQTMKNEINQEIAEPIQKLIDLVHSGHIEHFTINSRTKQPIGQHPYGQLTISIGLPDNVASKGAILGAGGTEPNEFMSPDFLKVTEPTVVKQLKSINTHLSAINDYLFDSIPPVENTFFFSLARLNKTAKWGEQPDLDQYPMIPRYVESYIKLQGTDNPESALVAAPKKLKM